MVTIRKVLDLVALLVPRVAPHVIGLAGMSAVVVGIWGWLGWEAGLIAAGAPFAAFYMAGQVLAVRGMMSRREV